MESDYRPSAIIEIYPTIFYKIGFYNFIQISAAHKSRYLNTLDFSLRIQSRRKKLMNASTVVISRIYPIIDVHSRIRALVMETREYKNAR